MCVWLFVHNSCRIHAIQCHIPVQSAKPFPKQIFLTWLAESSTNPALSNPSVDFSKCVFDVANFDFLPRPHLVKSPGTGPPGTARLGDDTDKLEVFLRLETSNIEAEMEDTWLVSLAIVVGFSWLRSLRQIYYCILLNDYYLSPSGHVLKIIGLN